MVGLGKQCRPISDTANVASDQGLSTCHSSISFFRHQQVVRWTGSILGCMVRNYGDNTLRDKGGNFCDVKFLFFFPLQSHLKMGLFQKERIWSQEEQTFGEDSFLEGDKNNFDRATSPEILISLKMSQHLG